MTSILIHSQHTLHEMRSPDKLVFFVTIVVAFLYQVYVALYDYTAADDDEITIKEGDQLSNVTVIDEGWMEGVNNSSGKFGMFPSNYVQRV